MKKYKTEPCSVCGSTERNGAIVITNKEGEVVYRVCYDCILDEWEGRWGAILDRETLEWMIMNHVPGVMRTVDLIAIDSGREMKCVGCHEIIENPDRVMVREYEKDGEICTSPICYDCLKKALKEKLGRDDISDEELEVYSYVMQFKELAECAEKFPEKKQLFDALVLPVAEMLEEKNKPYGFIRIEVIPPEEQKEEEEK